MKKFLPFFLLFFLSSSFALSNEFIWNKVVSSQDGSSDYYLDNKSTRTIGSYRYQWILNNKLKDNSEIKSNVDYAKIDCKRNKLQVVLISDYSEHFGKGKVTNHQLLDELEWLVAEPDTIMLAIIENSCKKKVSSISSDQDDGNLDENNDKKKKRNYKEF